MFILLSAMALTLSISFICSLMEAALLSLTPSQLADIEARYPKIGAIWREFKQNIERPIAVILILNTSAHTIGATIAGSQFDELYGVRWLWAFSLVFTFLMLQYTEILPKTLGVHFNRQVAIVIAAPLQGLIRLCSPVIHLLHWFNRPFEGRHRDPNRKTSLEELTALAAMARHAKEISPQQERIIQGATQLSERQVAEVMIPLEQVATIANDKTLTEALVLAHQEAHTRFPVCEAEQPHRIIGYVNFKEIVYSLHTNPTNPNLAGVMRPVRFVDRGTPANELLKAFIEQHIHMAIVRDAQDNHLGMVTLEDLIEELVGDLQDEFDRLPRHQHELKGGLWLFGGGIAMTDVAKAWPGRLAQAGGSLAGWLEQQLPGPPKPGQVWLHQGVEFTIRRVRRGRVFEVATRLVKPD